LPSTFRLQFHHTFGVSEKVERFEVPLIEQPPVNPLKMRWYLRLNKAPQRPVVSAGAVVGKAAGLIVIILETSAKHDTTVCCRPRFDLQFIRLVLQKSGKV
jgi:hypothetical protein